MFVRVQRSTESALRIARHFVGHPAISHVLYPGLETHPGHDVALRQMTGGFGGMLSIRHKRGEAAAIATAAEVAVFKRATSLGGVESLIEHRASVEGPSTPVPADLLRLSIGLEHPDDLIADLERALERAAAAESIPVGAPVHGGPSGLDEEDTGDPATTRLRRLVERQIRPLAIERGGDLTFRGYCDGIVELAYSGSPGAAIPIRGDIRNTIVHYVPEVVDVRLVVADADSGAREPVGPAGSVLERVNRILDARINPAVRVHRGFIRLMGIEGNTASIRFEGGCQGCAMADVTLRQGVEVIIKEQVAEIVAVVDITDHAGGANPYFKTRKGPS
jgi:Fe-S cluster biogenesis protein NfuA